MPKAWWRELLRRRRRIPQLKARPNEVRLLAFEEMEERRMLASLPPGFATSTFSAPWVNMGPSVIATDPAANTLPGVTVSNTTTPEDAGLTTPSPTDPVEGSVTSIATDPASPNIAWVGTANGGIFETQNLTNSTGPTWIPQLDSAKSMSIGSIYADPTDTTGNTVVAGIADESNYNSDDSDAAGTNIIATPVGGPLDGVYRSTNAASTAATWTLTNFPSGNYYVSVVEQGSIIMAASDSELGGVTSGSGATGALYRSINNGSTATSISSGGTNLLPSGAVSDIVADTKDQNYFYVAVLGANAGIYGTDNAGASWVRITGTGSTALPIDATDENVQIAISKPGTGGTTATMYVGLIDSSGNLAGVYKGSVTWLGTVPVSANASWTSVGMPTTTESDGTSYGLETIPTSDPGQQLSLTDFSIAADPSNGNLVYVGGDVQPGPFPNSVGAASAVGRLFSGNATTQKWTSLTGATAPAEGSHALVFDSSNNLLDASDGGIFKLTSPSTPGSWSSLMGAPNASFTPLSYPTGTTLTSLMDTEVTNVTDLPPTGSSATNPIVVGSAVNSGTFIQHSATTSQYDTILGGDGGIVTTDFINGYAPSSSSVTLYTSNANLQNLQKQTFGAGGQPAGTATTLALTVTGTTPTQTLYTYSNGIGLGYNSPLVTNNVMPGWIAIGSDYVFLSQDEGNTLAVDGGISSPFNVAHVNAMVYGGISAGAATFYPISPVTPKANPYLLWVGTSGASGSNLFVQLLNPASPTVNGQEPLGAQLVGIPGVTGDVTAITVDPNDDTIVFVGTAGGTVYQIVNTNPTGDPTWSNPQDLEAVAVTGGPGVGHITSMTYVPAAANSSGTDQVVVSGYGGVARASATSPNTWTNMSTSTTPGASLPNTPVMSLYYDQKNDTLVAGTLGRGIYEISGFARSLGGIQLTVTGDQLGNTTDTLLFEIDPFDPTLLDIELNFPTENEVQLPYVTVTKIVVDLKTGTNNVILDFSNGDPVPQGVNTFTYAATGGAQNTITVNDAGTFSLSNSNLAINGVNVGFPTAGNINNSVFNPIDNYTAATAVASTYNIGGTPQWTGNAALNGEVGVTNTINATMKNTSMQPISLANFGIEVLNGQLFTMQNVGVANLTAGAANSYMDISQWSGTGSLNGLGSGNLGFDNAPNVTAQGSTGGATYFAYSNTFFSVFNSEDMNLLGFTGMLLNGNGASNETFNNLGWVGVATIEGGPGTNSLYTSPPPGTIATPRNFTLYSPSTALPGYVYDGLVGGTANYAEEYPATGVAYNNYLNGGPGSTFDVSNYNALTDGTANGFGFVYVNGNGQGTTLNDAVAGGNQNMVLTNSSLFAATNSTNTNTIAVLIASVQNVILDTMTGNDTLIAYSWTGNAVFAAGAGQDNFYVGGPSGTYAAGGAAFDGDLDNMAGSTYVEGGTGGGSVLETNDYNYNTGSANMYYDINGSSAGGGSLTPDSQTPRAFQAVSWDSNVSNVIVSGAATSSESAVVKYLLTPSSTSAVTVYGNSNSVNNFLGTFFYHTAVQQLFDETSPTTAVQESAYVPNGDFWYWNFGNAAPIYFQNMGGINGLGLLALGGGTAPSVTSRPDVQVVNPATGELGTAFTVPNYPVGFTGGVSVASGNFTPGVKNSADEIVTAPGPGTSSLIDIFSTTGTLLYSFTAYASSFLGGVNVALGNVTNSGTGLDIVTAPQSGVEPVEVWHISNVTTTPTATLVRSFFPYGNTFTGGVSVGAGDFNLDGYADVVTAPYSGMATQVNVYSGAAISNPATPVDQINGMLNTFSAFASTFTGGSTVAVGDVDGDGVPDIVVAAGLDGSSEVQVMSGASVAAGGASIAELAGFQVFNSTSTNASGGNVNYQAPLRVALADVNGSGRDVLFATQGAGGNADAIDILYPLTGNRVVPDPGIALTNTAGGTNLG